MGLREGFIEIMPAFYWRTGPFRCELNWLIFLVVYMLGLENEFIIGDLFIGDLFKGDRLLSFLAVLSPFYTFCLIIANFLLLPISYPFSSFISFPFSHPPEIA